MKFSGTGRWLATRAAQLLRNDESSGQALLEFAVVAPLLLMLALGMCVFGIGLNEQLVLSNATELAAQEVAISRGQTTSTDNPCEIAESTFTSAAPNLTATSLTFTLTLSGQSSIPGTTGASSFATASNCSTDTLVEGQTVTLTVSYPYTASFINFGTRNYTLTSTIEQVIE
jgi:Flp pilus assembly protein TadG